MVPSQGDRSHPGHLRSRSRTISEGEDTAISGRFQSYKRGFLVELPASASIDQRIEIEDAIKKHEFIETSMFYEDMHWKFGVRGGPPVYVYFRNNCKSTGESVISHQCTNQSIPIKDRSFIHPVFRHPYYEFEQRMFFHFIVLLNEESK